MIQINKSTISIPKKLLTDGSIATEQLKELYIEDNDYQTGKKKFVFKRSIYAHKTVKKVLKDLHFNKCCFCEKKIETGHVEHYRSKGGYQQSENTPLIIPGYYWLTYDWENLFLSCQECNSSYKRNFFPLSNPSKRATSHLKQISQEKPLLINPSRENPEDYIAYMGDIPKAINGNIKGKTTITIAGLDRPYFDEHRRDHYQTVKILFYASELTNLSEASRKIIKSRLNKLCQPNAEYSSMIKCAIQDKFRF